MSYRTPVIHAAAALLGLTCANASALAQSPPADLSAPVTDMRYDVRFDARAGRTRLIHVTTTFSVGSTDAVLLSLPAWTPGAYEIENFARFVREFSATQNGKPLVWEKRDPDTWRVHPSGAGSVTVAFDYQATALDNAGSWAKRDLLLFNGTNLFLYPEGRLEGWGATVRVSTEPNWRIATSMHQRAPGEFDASNYHDLVDMPFLVGDFDFDSSQVAGKWMRLASYPRGLLAGSARGEVWRQLRAVVPPEVTIFGEAPWDRYTIIQIADSSYAGASGLEHQASHVDIITPLAIGNPFMPSLYAHEIFHAWNVKRLRPADMWPYRYDGPQPTPWLWVSEGITDYYADLAELRGGVIDSSAFVTMTSGKVDEVRSAPVISPADASLSTWLRPTDGTGSIYYSQGSLLGLLLDIAIRNGSDNRQSLDDVMRRLYRERYAAGRGFTHDDWWDAVRRAAGPSFAAASFEQRYVIGRDTFPLERMLPLAGMRAVADTLREPRLGISSITDSVGVRVTEVEPGGAAATAGIREGDVLLRVGDIDVGDETFGFQFRARYANAPGARVPVRLRRDGQPMVIPVAIQYATRLQWRVELDRAASPKAQRIRSGIFHGTVDH